MDIFLIRQKGERILPASRNRNHQSRPSLPLRICPFGVGGSAGEDFLILQFVPLAEVGGRIFDVRIILVRKDQTVTWQTSGALSRWP